MQAVVFLGEHELDLMAFDDPAPGPGEVVLEMKASGMCGSDLKYYPRPAMVAERPRWGWARCRDR